jgi:hypothetical protein
MVGTLESATRDSGIRLRTDVVAPPSAQTIIAELHEELARLGDALEAQRRLYDRALADEREERRLLMQTRTERAKRQIDEIADLRDENIRLTGERDSAKWSQRRCAASLKSLREDHERTGHAYRESLKALRLSFEQQLEVA